MKLLDEIIELLSSKDGSLTDALLKTKVLLHKIGHKELVEWVNYELNGYPRDDLVPDYRVLPSQVLASLANPAYHVQEHPIPLGHLTEQQRNGLETMRMKQSLAVLEKFGTTDKGKGSIVSPIPMEYNGILGQGLANNFQIQRAWCEVPVTEVASILVQVRSRLLDFALALRDKLPPDIDDTDTKKQAASIDTRGIFNNAIFGPNATVIVGDHNVQTVTNTIVKGDFNSLANALRQKKVSEEDIQSLRTAVDEDGPDVAANKGQVGPCVKAWMERMWSKAVELSWQIELNVAGSLLATALWQYYGWR